MEMPFGEVGRYYDLLYEDKQYGSEVTYLRALLDAKTTKLLELGSGSGVHAQFLGNLGYSVTGVERCESMLARANKRNKDFRGCSGQVSFVAGDIRDVKVNTIFDGVISLFHVMSYQTSEEDLRAVFRTASQHLDVGGQFIFDFWYGPAVLWQKPSVRIKRVKDSDVEVTRIAEPEMRSEDNTVEVRYEIYVKRLRDGVIRSFHEAHRMRYFFLPELVGFGSEVGFELEAANAWETKCLPTVDSWAACAVFRKKGG